MQIRTAVEISVPVVVSVLILPVYAYIYGQATRQVAQTILSVYGGVETVQAAGSIPNEMDRNQFGFLGATFWNPTSLVYQI